MRTPARNTYNSFKQRAAHTRSINTSNPPRGGWRL